MCSIKRWLSRELVLAHTSANLSPILQNISMTISFQGSSFNSQISFQTFSDNYLGYWTLTRLGAFGQMQIICYGTNGMETEFRLVVLVLDISDYLLETTVTFGNVCLGCFLTAFFFFESLGCEVSIINLARLFSRSLDSDILIT